VYVERNSVMRSYNHCCGVNLTMRVSVSLRYVALSTT